MNSKRRRRSPHLAFRARSARAPGRPVVRPSVARADCLGTLPLRVANTSWTDDVLESRAQRGVVGRRKSRIAPPPLTVHQGSADLQLSEGRAAGEPSSKGIHVKLKDPGAVVRRLRRASGIRPGRPSDRTRYTQCSTLEGSRCFAIDTVEQDVGLVVADVRSSL